ncbi:glycoside hydrolase family 38 C-terminal domain-containing protein [Endozoicomonas arenosclerae]|uniref:glycoside hydrolase family 38 N-terminal domain-containing protein n=1 Tax=Endozoicomonas arenosclerae TaxID=1633495 RepID=UPI00078293A0|nr:glycoside hydrolase family 38 C-terminal domain-containing protein [Endozoicomonas arenosclerae]
MAKVHVLPHTHWDREWYFTQQDSDVLATYNFTKVIETLETESDYSVYHLDGQSSIVEDYLKVLPHMRDRMAKLVGDRKLLIGPWYTQTDSFNVAGESIIRNLKYGMHVAESLGHSMKVGYLPDTFGHNAQMPTLFKGCGIDNIIFWRGIDFDQQVEKSNFIWTSLGGDNIIACNLVHGYGAAKNIVAEPAHLDKKIFPMVEKIKALSGLDEVLIPSGGDQVNIDPNLPETLRIATERSPADDIYQISSMEAYVDYLRGQQDRFENYVGEFKAPRYARIHKTIGSVRYDIKKLNFEIEQFLLKKLEPVVAIAKASGIRVHTQLIDIAWKKIIECHAHDSMGGCNSDATNADIMHRLKQAEEICHGLYNLVIKEIASQVCAESEIMVFNNRVKPYTGLVNLVVFSKFESIQLKQGDKVVPTEILYRETLDGGKVIEVTKDGEKEVPVPPYYRFELKAEVDQLPAMGYRIYSLESSESTPEAKAVDHQRIENDRYCLKLENGQLTLLDKTSGREISELFQFENVADDGDSYDFSPLRGDQAILSEGFEWLETQRGETVQVMKLWLNMPVPGDMAERQKGKRESEIGFNLTLTLEKDATQLAVTIETLNQVKDHRVRLLVNSDIHTENSISTLPFGVISRPVVNQPAEGWEKQYREAPVDIETTEGAVALAQQGRAMVLTGRGLKEFQILEASAQGCNKVALTLFKSVGVLGNDNLAWRPGRASGINNTVVYTPDAQLQKCMTFSFALALTEDASHKTVREQESDYLSRPFAYQKQGLNSFENRLERFQVSFDQKVLAREFSLVSVQEDLEVSSISHSLNDENVLLLRLFNAGDTEVNVDLAQFYEFADVSVVNYCEQPVEVEEAICRPMNTLDLKLVIDPSALSE